MGKARGDYYAQKNSQRVLPPLVLEFLKDQGRKDIPFQTGSHLGIRRDLITHGVFGFRDFECSNYSRNGYPDACGAEVLARADPIS
jgi:hypothetical protein